MIPWPIDVQCVAVSTTTNPVTVTAEVAVNKDKIGSPHPPPWCANGAERKAAPININTRNTPTKISGDEKVRLFMLLSSTLNVTGDISERLGLFTNMSPRRLLNLVFI
jgi:hypothetical protein